MGMAALYHNDNAVFAIIVGLLWVMVMILVGLFLATLWTARGVVFAGQWSWTKYQGRYRGRHRT